MAMKKTLLAALAALMSLQAPDLAQNSEVNPKGSNVDKIDGNDITFGR